MSVSFNGSYSQSFDGLAASGSGLTWTNDLTLEGWYLFRQPEPGTAITAYTTGSGSANAGSFYSFGASGDSDRALGGVGSGGSYFGSASSGALAGWIALALTNDTASVIDALDLSFAGEQWRNGGNTSLQDMVLEFGIGVDLASVPSWITPGGSFTWSSPVIGSSAAAVDGNSAGRVNGRGGQLTNLGWQSGSTLWLRWQERNDSGNDHGLAIDDLSLTLAGAVSPTVSVVALDDQATEGSADTGLFRFSRSGGDLGVALIVPYVLAAGPGAADQADVAEMLSGSVTIPVGASSVDLEITALEDGLAEGQETLALSLPPQTGVSLGTADASVTISDALAITPISAIQGSGSSSPLQGQTVRVRAVVVGDFQASVELGGVFLQEETVDWDSDPLSSEGLYVAYGLGGLNLDLAVGDRVLVSGTVAESFGRTSLTTITALSREATGVLDDVAITTIPDLVAARSSVADLEPWEGMWVRFDEPLTVNGLFGQFRFGEVELSAGGLPEQPTNVQLPGAAAYAAEQAMARRELVLDDGSNTSYRTAANATAAAPVVADLLLRRGDQVSAPLEGVLSYDFNRYRLQPTAPVSFTSLNPRPLTAPERHGDLRVASFNVLNLFSTLNASGALTDTGLAPRGANSAAELDRQLTKLTTALLGLDADVIGLMEVENDADDATLALLVGRLNQAAAAAGSARSFAPVPTGLIGSDAIKVALIYDPTVVAPVGDAAVLDTPAFTNPLGYATDKNRPALAQSFRQIEGGEVLNLVVNHLKSKGAADAVGADQDQLDGQSAYNATRLAAAAELARWLQRDPTGSGDPDWMILGDLNSYAKEDPIRLLESEGYVNAIPAFTGVPPRSYAFFNPVDMTGALDHALLSPSMRAQAVAAEEWAINSAEPAFRDYNLDSSSNGNASRQDFFAIDPFRTSDHDPLVVDLQLVTPSGVDAVAGRQAAEVFASGVASGDPYGDSVILWTRISPPSGFAAASIPVQWEIATSADFAAGTVLNSGLFSTTADRDWTVKVEASGLQPGSRYYYRFTVGGVTSRTGETRTLSSDAESVRLAVFSCANFTAAEAFEAYSRAAEINRSQPYDAILHLGDYIYEYGQGGYPQAEDAAGDRGFVPAQELITLADYRLRYQQYHTDQGLVDLRAGAPLIAIWDDHETANNSYRDGAENHDTATEGSWTTRRDAALRAYYEWLPIREPERRRGSDAGSATTPLTQGYRSFDFSDVLSLHVLETRLTARDRQLDYADGPVQQVLATAYGDPSRQMIGAAQLAWLTQEMATSTATWQLLGQQTLMQNMTVPAELLLGATAVTQLATTDPAAAQAQLLALLSQYATPLQKRADGLPLTVEEQALLSSPQKIPFNLDAWDGYGVERETILQTAQALGKKLVSLAGDTHNAWAGVLDTFTADPNTPGAVVGVELATPGVTSPGLERLLPGADAFLRQAFPGIDGLDGLFRAYVPDLAYADLNRRGFLDLTVNHAGIAAGFELLSGRDATTGLPQWSRNSLAVGADLSLTPVPPSVSAVGGADSRVSARLGDNRITGTTDPGRALQLLVDGSVLTTVQADAQGGFSHAFSPQELRSLGQGTHQLVARPADLAVGEADSDPLAFAVDTLKATRSQDVLVGTALADDFIFPSFHTGVPGAGRLSYDTIVDYQVGDRIDIRRFSERVMGAPTSRRITKVEGEAKNLS
ncbi:MAG: ExeM/NucH family extracellular endonuclease, partial [Cyanobacteriota bacterium]|nr:ExeM/NucH family extracellular endonuclease [Cyanobacteriota bacterium]